MAGRAADPQEIVDLILYLASEQGAFLRAEYRICELLLVFLLCFYKI